jgi:hypothetical protein
MWGWVGPCWPSGHGQAKPTSRREPAQQDRKKTSSAFRCLRRRFPPMPDWMYLGIALAWPAVLVIVVWVAGGELTMIERGQDDRGMGGSAFWDDRIRFLVRRRLRNGVRCRAGQDHLLPAVEAVSRLAKNACGSTTSKPAFVFDAYRARREPPSPADSSTDRLAAQRRRPRRQLLRRPVVRARALGRAADPRPRGPASCGCRTPRPPRSPRRFQRTR